MHEQHRAPGRIGAGLLEQEKVDVPALFGPVLIGGDSRLQPPVARRLSLTGDKLTPFGTFRSCHHL